MAAALTNWAGNHAFAAARVHRPRSVDEVFELAARSRKLKVLGTRHSFNDVADCDGDLLSLEHFNDVLAIEDGGGGADAPRPRVTVEAGVTYGRLCRHLHAHGYALHNLASLPHISVAGACATGTHGSGDGNGNLATAVTAMEIVTGDGRTERIARRGDADAFAGAVVSLGGLGVVLRLTLEIVPAFEVAQEVFENLPLEAAEAHFDEIFSSAYSVSLFTDWRSDRFNQAWVKRRAGDDPRGRSDPTAFGATRATRKLHPIGHMSPVNCTEQMGVPGPAHERLSHFRMDYTPSSGEELQSEYLLPRAHAAAALRTVYDLRERVAPLLQISEIRTIAADGLWLSPSYEQASVAIHFTWRKDWDGVRSLLPELERRLAPFAARPHWGKLFTTPPTQLQALYPKLDDFRQLLHRYDPPGKFRNAFTERNLFGSDATPDASA